MTQNLTLGRGKLYFSRFAPNTYNPVAFDYVGNTPEINLNIEAEMLDHYSSDAGIKEKDDSMTLQVNRTGSFITDNINFENLANFFFGSTALFTQAAAAAQTEIILAPKKGAFYKLGISPTNPTGFMGINPVGFAVKLTAAPTTVYVLGTDYKLDAASGMIEILAAGAIGGASITVDYAVAASTRTRVISGGVPVEGAIQYVANNPKGPNRNMYLPWTKLTPNGDFALKGDEWQQLPFNVEVLKPIVGEAIYIDGLPA